MSKECDICGKKPSVGKKIIRHGIPKKKGGIGMHTTGFHAEPSEGPRQN